MRRFEFRRLGDWHPAAVSAPGRAPDAAPKAGEAAGLREHPLAVVDGAEVPGGRLAVLFGPRIIGGRYFRLHLEGEGASRRFLTGLHNSGRYPGQNWAEVIDLDLPPALAGDGPAGHEGWERDLAEYLRPLADAIPPGGHLMVEYETDKWLPTQRGLLQGIPPIATPMGEMLHRLGSASSIKDWYFPEGGQEGSRKLHGNKALSPRHAAETGRARAAELRAFLASPPGADRALDGAARAAAERILTDLPDD
ncbi:MAG TPA: DUF1122 family protein [Candidatus Dormibacteraeota bacterium]|nr:DUF1122 family protein [Candidatus Dormibacteraeota bacterium]